MVCEGQALDIAVLDLIPSQTTVVTHLRKRDDFPYNIGWF